MNISTPCIGLCVLDEVAGLCVGCGRTRREIGGWSTMSEGARQSLMQTLPGRLVALQTITPEAGNGANPSERD